MHIFYENLGCFLIFNNRALSIIQSLGLTIEALAAETFSSQQAFSILYRSVCVPILKTIGTRSFREWIFEKLTFHHHPTSILHKRQKSIIEFS